MKGNAISLPYNYTQGYDVVIDSIGNTVLISFTFGGHEVVYEYKNNNWVQKGNLMLFTYQGMVGYCTDISNNGNIIAIGYPWYTNEQFVRKGCIMIYQYDGNDWEMLGDTIIGPWGLSLYGLAFNLSANGKIVYNLNQSGELSIYKLINNQWVNYGNPINITNFYFSHFTRESFVVNDNASIIAYGIPDCDSAGINAGMIKVLHNPTVDIADNSKSDVIITYPNPVKDYFYIENASGYDYAIFDICGKCLSRAFIRENNQKIDATHLSRGMYFISFYKQKQLISTWKFIKQ
jgi:hypothetical protein